MMMTSWLFRSGNFVHPRYLGAVVTADATVEALEPIHRLEEREILVSRNGKMPTGHARQSLKALFQIQELQAGGVIHIVVRKAWFLANVAAIDQIMNLILTNLKVPDQKAGSANGQAENA
jgi:hypothetical protein